MFVVEKKPKSIAAEAYRTLRTNIQYSFYEKEVKIITVTSTKTQEGKSTVAGNLALLFAKDNKRVVIIDCDLRRPTIHKKFAISNNVGVSDIVTGKSTIEGAIKATDLNVDIITSGKIPPNPSELLGSRNMDKLLSLLRNKYDYIIIDSPPVLSVTDPQVLAVKADGVIFVVREDFAKKEEVIQARKNLDKVKANIVGSVLTGSTKSVNHYYYGDEESETRQTRQTRRKRNK